MPWDPLLSVTALFTVSSDTPIVSFQVKMLPTSSFSSLALEKEEEAKSVLAGTLTGLLFKSTSGSLLKCAKGGLVGVDLTEDVANNVTQVGLGISAVWAFGLRKQESVQHYI